jgi:cysteine desulfurase
MIDPEQIIYLDNNATTRPDPAVVQEMVLYLEKLWGNPSSGYMFGKQVRKAVELARQRLATLLGCEPSEIIFTSGGTESNNTAINAALRVDPKRQHVVTTAVEHNAVVRHCEDVAQHGGDVTFVGVNSEGELDLVELEKAIRPDTAIVSVMWANNETGVVNPIDEVAEIARRKGVLLHTDAVQAVGKVPLKLSERSGIGFLSLSAHKFHGPKGVGALYVNRNVRFSPMIFGGSQENKRRGGTENVASIVGLGKAAELAVTALKEDQDRIHQLRDRFEAELLEKIPDLVVNGNSRHRLGNTSNLSFRGIDAQALLIMFDQKGICSSIGSACLTGSLHSSHVLRAMKLDDDRAKGSVRFSLGRFNTEAQIEKALQLIPPIIEKLRALSPAPAIA